MRETAQNIISDLSTCCGAFPLSMFMLLTPKEKGRMEGLEFVCRLNPALQEQGWLQIEHYSQECFLLSAVASPTALSEALNR